MVSKRRVHFIHFLPDPVAGRAMEPGGVHHGRHFKACAVSFHDYFHIRVNEGTLHGVRGVSSAGAREQIP